MGRDDWRLDLSAIALTRRAEAEQQIRQVLEIAFDGSSEFIAEIIVASNIGAEITRVARSLGEIGEDFVAETPTMRVQGKLLGECDGTDYRGHIIIDGSLVRNWTPVERLRGSALILHEAIHAFWDHRWCQAYGEGW